MTVPQCVNSPGNAPVHDVQRWHVIVVTVTITVVVLACAGVSPDWLSGVASRLA